jgi:hypothetical protein
MIFVKNLILQIKNLDKKHWFGLKFEKVISPYKDSDE